jgi:hypothetical protein
MIDLLIFAFATAGLCLLLDFCFEKNHIFSFWLPFVSKLLNYKHLKQLKYSLSDLEDDLREFISQSQKENDAVKSKRLHEKIEHYKILIYEKKTDLYSYDYWYELGQTGEYFWLFYPLGFCIFCFSVWLSFVTYTLTHLFTFNLLDMFIMSFCTFAFIRLIYKNE